MQPAAHKTETMKLNLGSGFRQIPGYIGIDCRDLGQELVFDIVKHGLPFEDDTITEVLANDFLEHIPMGKTIYVIEEIWRVLVPDGLFRSFTPDAETGQAAFQDPTHVSFWVRNSFMYYMDDAHRELYGITAKFRGSVRSVITNAHLNIQHLEAELYAVK